jgi:hypothetical protein
MDIQDGYRDTLLRWYDEEFLPETLRVNGWLHASRYICVLGEPRELVLFAIPSLDDGIQRELTAIPIAEPAMARRLRNYSGHTFQRVFHAGNPAEGTGIINVIATEVRTSRRIEFDNWYSRVHVPEILACPGWISARRYQAVDRENEFLAIYDLADAIQPFTSRDYEAAVGWDEHDSSLLGYHGFRIFELETSVSAF